MMELREFLILRKPRSGCLEGTQGAGPAICLTRASAGMRTPQSDERESNSINLGVVGTEFRRREAGNLLGLDPLEAQIGVAVQWPEPSADGFGGLEIVERLVERLRQ